MGRTLGIIGVVGIVSLGCSGMLDPGPCCTVADVIAMHESGVQTKVILDAVCNSQTQVDLSASDITELSTAGVDRSVIDAMSTGCGEGGVDKPAMDPIAGDEPPPPLKIKIVKNTAKSIEVFNLSSRRYTNVRIVINGEYLYQLKRLPPGKGDVMRFGSFHSTRTGAELKKARLETITVTADQGSYTQSF